MRRGEHHPEPVRRGPPVPERSGCPMTGGRPSIAQGRGISLFQRSANCYRRRGAPNTGFHTQDAHRRGLPSQVKGDRFRAYSRRRSPVRIRLLALLSHLSLRQGTGFSKDGDLSSSQDRSPARKSLYLSPKCFILTVLREACICQDERGPDHLIGTVNTRWGSTIILDGHPNRCPGSG